MGFSHTINQNTHTQEVWKESGNQKQTEGDTLQGDTLPFLINRGGPKVQDVQMGVLHSHTET